MTNTLPNNNVVFLKQDRVVDPFVNYIKRSQKEEKSPDKNSKKSPYLRTKSRHIWKGAFPNSLEKGYHKIEITIKDPNFLEIKKSFWVLKE